MLAEIASARADNDQSRQQEKIAELMIVNSTELCLWHRLSKG